MEEPKDITPGSRRTQSETLNKVRRQVGSLDMSFDFELPPKSSLVTSSTCRWLDSIVTLPGTERVDEPTSSHYFICYSELAKGYRMCHDHCEKLSAYSAES